jgi:arsenate reductase
MAEAFMNELGSPGKVHAMSAGLEPGKLNMKVVESMKEVGIDISQAKTNSVAEMIALGPIFKYVITVCDETSAERCPKFPGNVIRLHWGFPDPSAL